APPEQIGQVWRRAWLPNRRLLVLQGSLSSSTRRQPLTLHLVADWPFFPQPRPRRMSPVPPLRLAIDRILRRLGCWRPAIQFPLPELWHPHQIRSLTVRLPLLDANYS